MMKVGSAELLAHARQTMAARELSRSVELLHAAERAGAPADVCAGERWYAHALAGDYAAAWHESDAIRARGAPDPHRFWLGGPVNGKRVVLRSLHGLGDAVQMFRYLPRLQAMCAHLTVEVPPPLVALVPAFLRADLPADVITWGEAAPPQPPAWDVQIEVMELPYLFRTTVQELPLATHYLHLPGTEIAAAAAAMGSRSRRRVGLVWQCGVWNSSRDLPLELATNLVAIDAIEWWNLQDSPRAGALLGTRNAAEVVGDGLVPLAAAIANLDLVVTPDTLAAHLAGALGVPAFVLLQHSADWRWMAAGDRSPWYPSLRLFRQPAPGNWTAVFAAVRDALEALNGAAPAPV